jgi:hypothetical protein
VVCWTDGLPSVPRFPKHSQRGPRPSQELPQHSDHLKGRNSVSVEPGPAEVLGGLQERLEHSGYQNPSCVPGPFPSSIQIALAGAVALASVRPSASSVEELSGRTYAQKTLGPVYRSGRRERRSFVYLAPPVAGGARKEPGSLPSASPCEEEAVGRPERSAETPASTNVEALGSALGASSFTELTSLNRSMGIVCCWAGGEGA